MKERNPPADPATFEDLYAEHEDRVVTLLWRFGVPSSECKDVAQEVWLDVHLSLPVFDPTAGSARAWLTGFARNAAREWKRARQRRPMLTGIDHEPIEASTSEMEAEERQRSAALWAHLERAVPNEDQREAWILHEIEGLTIEEVARITGVRPCTVKWRIRMARRKLKEGMTEEERRKLAAILPVFSMDAFVRALRETPKLSGDVSAQVWERVKERIEAHGGSIHDRLGAPDDAPGPAAPRSYTFTGRGLASTLGGVFVAGALTGALAHAHLSSPSQVSVTAIEAEIAAPLRTAALQAEPPPTASLAASASSSPTPSASSRAVLSASSPAAAAPPASEAWLIERARNADPAEALLLAEQHARTFPAGAYAATREEIAIYALVQLGRRAEAEARAAKLVRLSPKTRPKMERLFGRSTF